MPRISVKQAVQAAVDFLREIQSGTPPEDLAVEEVEFSDDGLRWVITVGFYPSGSSLARVTGQQVQRSYKQFEVDAGTGAVLSMKIRKV